MKHKRCLLLSMGFLCACIAAPRMHMEVAEQGRLSRTLANQHHFLRISFFVTAFFEDDSLQLLSPVNPAWLHLLEDTEGNPVPPGEITEPRLLPAGTLVQILNVEFPNASTIGRRAAYSPRTRTWVYVAAPSASKPLVLVLKNTFQDSHDFLAELHRFLTPLNPASLMAQFSTDEQNAIRNKEAFPGMSAEALEMALGYPETKTIVFEGEQKTETWLWGRGKKTLTLKGGRIVP